MFSRFKSKKINLDLKPGDKHYRSFIGPPAKYDLVSAMQFNLLTKYGLRETHKLLDIGCGSLRGGRFFIIYLLDKNYYGVEPEKWLVNDGVHYELGKGIVKLKKPSFLYDSDFKFDSFGVKFDFALAQSIFTHASAEQIRTCMFNLTKVAGKEFKFLASFIEGDKNYDGDAWVYPGCVTYKMDFMKKIIGEYGFSCKKIQEAHPNNHTWLLIEN